MICDRCGRENPDHLIFCQDCGRRLQGLAARVVPPTPPAGVPAVQMPVAPVETRPVEPSPAAPAVAAQVPAELVCARCQTRNPMAGKYCVSCGAPMQAPAAQPGVDLASQPAQSPTDHAAPIAAAGVVHVSAPQPEPASTAITCARCQGVCEGGMRFCKFCGAPLPGAPVSQAGPPTPERYVALNDPAERGYGPPVSPRADTDQPPPSPAAVEPAPSDRSRTRPASSQSPVDSGDQQLDRTREEPPVGAKTGQYVPFAGGVSLPSGRLVVVGGDGQEGPSFPLTGDQVDIGRAEGTVVLPDDRYMSPRHARLVRLDGRWHVRDLQSTNGVFYRISKPHELVDGDLLLLGVEVLRFEFVMEAELGLGPAVQHGTLVFGSPALPRPARLVQRTVEGVARDVYHLHRLETVIGRESGDIVFTDDPYMSRRHAMVRRTTAGGAVSLVDLNSSNGTFVAIRGDVALEDGDSIRVGQHLFRVELGPR